MGTKEIDLPAALVDIRCSKAPCVIHDSREPRRVACRYRGPNREDQREDPAV